MISPESRSDFEKIESAIFAYIQQLCSRSQNPSEGRVLLIGPLPDGLEETFLNHWKTLSNRPVCNRAFRTVAEFEHWRRYFGPVAIGIESLLITIGEESALPLAGFDLVTTLETDLEISPRGIAGLKRLLKRNGTILMASQAEAISGIKDSLKSAGFQQIVARSEARRERASNIDFVIARSDGRVRTSIQTGPQSLDAKSTSTPRMENSVAVQTDRLATVERTSNRAAPKKETVREAIISLIDQILQLPPGVLDTSSPFTEFGIDSIGGVVLINQLNLRLGLELKPTVLFDYASVEKLSTYISEQCRPLITEVNGTKETEIIPSQGEIPPLTQEVERVRPTLDSLRSPGRTAQKTDIAVIGIAGRFPEAEDVAQFWNNLVAARNSISEAPADRWGGDTLPTNPNERTSPRRGGFLSSAADFDPLFFSISGREAEVTDPQQRLFLEEAYHALEDAGYAGVSANLAKKCGVFVGVEPGDYLHVLMEVGDRVQNSSVFQGNAESILAARISYFLDLKGPSIAINTACSSSLVSIHLACQSLINGECDLALAGGVRVLASDKAYRALGNMGMLSPDGQCKTFDEAADGFVPGEAVGVLVLKSLQAALEDRDHIYGVIKGSAINQDGRTNGITAPSTLSQTQVQLEVYERFGLNPETFQYVEAHGTGTKLGDPIEIEALTAAFGRFTSKKSFCGIGSVKTNIGHTMAAAGVCSAIKVLLGLKHAKIPPSLNLHTTNRYIDFQNSPFFANTTVRDWSVAAGEPRRAAVSSFGFSGTNSHLVLEQAPFQEIPSRQLAKPAYLVTLSAKSQEGLDRQLVRLSKWLDSEGGLANLENVSFTLNQGRGHFEYRSAFVASSIEELRAAVNRLALGEHSGNAWRSSGNHTEDADDVIFRQLAAELVKQLPNAAQQDESAYREKLSALAALYVKGYDFDGTLLHAGESHRRISLPGYAFARERYWIASTKAPATPPAFKAELPVLAIAENARSRSANDRRHPLVHFEKPGANPSEFISSFDGSEFFFAEHQVSGVKILPGVAYLEMAMAATQQLTGESRLALSNVAWLRPLTADQAGHVSVRLKRDGSEVRFEVRSLDSNLLHAEGKVICGAELGDKREDLSEIRVRCSQKEDVDQIYGRCSAAGLELGHSFRSIQEVWVGHNEALARLEVSSSAEFRLHPGLLDGALQTIAVLGQSQEVGLPVPFAVREVQVNTLGNKCYAFVRRGEAGKDLLRFDILLLDESGQVQVELRALTMRALTGALSAKELKLVYARPAWQKMSLDETAGRLSGRLLLFDHPDARLANEIRALCPELSVVSINPGARFESVSKGFCVQPDSASDYQRLLEVSPPDFVVFRWMVDTTDIDAALEHCVLPLFHFVRALFLRGINHPVRLLVPYQCETNPAYAALAGYSRTLEQERPNLRLTLVQSAAAASAEIVRELRNQNRDVEIRYIEGERQVKKPEIFAPEPIRALPIREFGVYVVTGGLGGLGRIFSRYLAEVYRARLILIGRSEALSQENAFLDELKNAGGDASYLRADVAAQGELELALALARSRFGDIQGVIHAAGLIQDSFILKKEDFVSVMRPKVLGTMTLDRLTANDPLDFFVLFSSIASVFGNLGQSDYAYANRFLDEFARLREQQRISKQRFGVTVSIGWPLWRNGGMSLNSELELRKLSELGLHALEDNQGLSIFETGLRSGEPEIVAFSGTTESVRALIERAEGGPGRPPEKPADSAPDSRLGSVLREETLRYLSRAFSELIKIPEARIRPSDSFDKFGIDSILVMEFTRILEKDFADLPKTLLFEHRNLADLTGYFTSVHATRLQQLFGVNSEQLDKAKAPVGPSEIGLESGAASRLAPASENASRFTLESGTGDDIAIVGVFGRYPMADDLNQFWDNLRSGRDCIVEIPSERWDYRIFYDPEPGKPGKTRNKWGGFINNVERFDPLFFGITPREASALDPQERLFLETAWRTVEDAGYRKSALAGKKVGVFVGVMYGQYQLYGAGDVETGNVFPLSSFYSSIANRVSYFFDWRGPSMAVDTMCSSSLTAIHLACESLRRHETELGLAGGVNVTLHPHKDMLMAPGGFAASDGRCRSFGEGGDGYVPGEGVGAVLLKRVSQAIADRDHIYAVIKASSLNHGGKTNGYTVPNPNAQAELVLEAFARGQVDPTSINYFEAHGTGTALGDPIEIAGMTKAFREAMTTPANSYRCAVGSVKSNIGHLESAAGIAGLTKVLLQMQHREIVPSLHSARLNPNIRFAESGFYVPQQVEPWAPVASGNDVPIRRAGVSSFGAGGANAHILIEEFVQPEARTSDANESGVFILSAKTEDCLRAKAEQLADYLSRSSRDLASAIDIAYTLQVGREPFNQRLAIVAINLAELRERLAGFLSGAKTDGVFHSNIQEDEERLRSFLDGEEGELLLESLIRQRKWSKLAHLWACGGEVNWERFYEGVKVCRVPLPTYPFAGQRYWAPRTLKLKTDQSDATLARTKQNETNTVSPNETTLEKAVLTEPGECIFLRPRWQDRPPQGETPIPLQAHLLLFDREDSFRRDVQADHPGWSITRVIPGEAYSNDDGTAVINPEHPDDFQRLIAAAKPDLVIHRWSDITKELDYAFRHGVFTLFHLCKALIASSLHSTVRIVVCDGQDSHPATTGLSAFARAVALEQPQLQLRVVQSDQIDVAILGDLFAEDEQRQIRWMSGRRQVLLPESFEPRTLDPVPLRRDGVYLITGGLGGLGQIFAKRLAKDFAARLILTGRSALAEQTLSAIRELEKFGSEVEYLQCDVGSANEVNGLLRRVRERFGGLNGILHTAGVLRDGFLLRKSSAEFAEVIRAKVQGTMLLDQATKDEPLDFFALFSSTVGTFGNVGQVDYSYANAFLDGFASLRERLRVAGTRTGKTFSIGWPLWEDKGMAQRASQAKEHLRQIGLQPISEHVGYEIFEIALNGTESQIVPLYGSREKVARSLFGAQGTNGKTESAAGSKLDKGQLLEKTEIYLKSILAEVTELPVDQLDSRQRFEEFGVDSIVVSDFNLRIDKDLGPLPKTLLFEHANFRQLSIHLVEAFGSRIAQFFGTGIEAEEAEAAPSKNGTHQHASVVFAGVVPSKSPIAETEEIAIIGLSGKYPKADDVRAFWKLLRKGTDCVTEIPKKRWDIDRFFDPDPEKAAAGKMYGRWGAFLDEVDKFDSLFFNIPPLEAELVDPQERLFLETAWSVLEDAGYTRLDLTRTVRPEYAANVGVFVGVTSNDYATLAQERHGSAIPITLPWSIANRVSYLFNFNGPSMPVDTACSSSLVAIHLACEAIRRGECQQAIAGGVNLYLHPSRYVSLCLARMLSSDGKCRAFGEGGTGFVPGEGVGAVFLKPLSLALTDRDHIYGVIKGTAVNHGGRTNGYTVPNPKAQSELVRRALQKAKIDPRTVTYLEAHGTGTALGDPIELTGLTNAFNEASPKSPVAGGCAVGSVKTNIGHLESAAGIAGLTKVLLQFKAGELAPSLHAEKINPNIVLEETPFRLQRDLEPWGLASVDDKIWPRRAGISSFGAGGTNAHVIVEEFVPATAAQSVTNDSPWLIILSARSEESLRDNAIRLARFLIECGSEETPIESVAYTLQIGREPFEQRIAFIVTNRDELIINLERVAVGDFANAVYGRVRRERIQLDGECDEPDPAVVSALRARDLEALAKLWVRGALVDWSALWGQASSLGRISLPAYAFRRERHWIDAGRDELLLIRGTAGNVEETRPSHDDHKRDLSPLTKDSESLPNSGSYARAFTGQEIILRDHQIGGEAIFPGAGSLDLAMAAAADTLGSSSIRLRNIVWLRPLVSRANGLNVRLNIRPDGSDRVAFDLLDAEGQVAMQGKAERIAESSIDKLDLIELRKRCESSISPDELYRVFANRHIEYGPGFRVLDDVRYGTEEVLAELRVPKVWSDEADRLHPVLFDGALQSLAAIGPKEGEVYIPFALDSLECIGTLPQRCYAYSRAQGEGASRNFEVRMLSEAGDVLGKLSGFRMRPLETVRREIIVCRPRWVSESAFGHPSFTGSVLLFDDEIELAQGIEQQGNRVVRVTFSEQPKRLESEVRLGRGDQEAYDRLVIGQEFDAIIHAWSGRKSGFDEALERGPLSVHRLAKALINSGRVAPWLFVYPTGEPIYQAIGGYGKSLRQEHPKLLLKTVCISEVEAADLLLELSDSEFEVRYKGGNGREVRKLEEWVMPAPVTELGLRSGGVYLLTGGAGGLGRIFSKYLLETFNARLVLAGRSDWPRDWPAPPEKSAVYVQADVSTIEGSEKAVAEAKQRFGELNGIIHAAGVLRDGLIRTKSEKDFLAVLRAKAQGAEVLDQVTQNHPLDFFALFSSTAALVGNAGQADYAYANAYLDAFASRREELRLRGQRSGHSVSINWPLWKEGGMQATAEALRFQATVAGLQPLETDEGVKIFRQIMASGEAQCAVFYGSPRRWLNRSNTQAQPALVRGDAKEKERLVPKAELLEKLRALVAKVLKLDPSVIEEDADTSEYGFDSVTFTTLANELNSLLGVETTPAVLFEYTTLDKLADFLCREYGDQLDLKVKPVTAGVEKPDSDQTLNLQPIPEAFRESRIVSDYSHSGSTGRDSNVQSIAVVGMSGIFPGSPDLSRFWKHLDSGKDLISKPPAGRWNFSAKELGTGRAGAAMEPPWGGFMPNVDQFDPLFFDISPREAELMDPQQRLFLKTVWHTLEDAGYSKSKLAGSKTGVFVGVAANDYANLLAMAGIPVEAYSSTGNAHSVLANRVSFFFDWHGPSEAIDTACSSSLVAIHRAIESIVSGSCNLAIAGGVNVLLSPAAFVAFGKAGMLCPDGRCKSFDADANGYVRGEGVGAILLKPLKQALQDHDHIYGVIRGSAENHGGRVQGLTVPNPNAQGWLLKDAYEKAGIDPFTIGYIEAHGTGTSLGDPMEVNGLKKAFSESSDVVRNARCAIASVKSNIGHLETAAGIAGIIKVLLSMQHRRIPGNIHLKRLNPYIQVEGTPFYFPEKTVAWESLIDRANQTLPRRAGVSSFGFGGSNAHVVLEEYSVAPRTETPNVARPELVLLSARSPDRLRALVSNFSDYLRSLGSEANAWLRPSLTQIAFTMQVGREAMNERLCIIASDINELLQELEKFERGEGFDGVAGNLEANKAGLQLLQELHPDDSYLEPLLRERALRKLARLWVGGVKIEWEKLWIAEEVSRASLPGYAFEQHRFWVPKTHSMDLISDATGHRLHPLLHRNESTLSSHVYRSEFDGREIFFRDHVVAGREVLPGAASLELALVGASLALETTKVALRRVVWLRPIIGGSERVALSLTLSPDAKEAVQFELKSSGTDVHVSGYAEVIDFDFPEDLDLVAIRSRCEQKVSSHQLYGAFGQRGLNYGDAFRVIEEICYSGSEALSKLQIPSIWGDKNFRLHPALLDGAFQSLATIESKSESGIKLPFAIDQVVCPDPLPSCCYAFVQLTLSENGERRHTIKLANEEGRVLAWISGLSCRRLATDQVEPFYYRPVWKESELVVGERSEPECSWLVFDNQHTTNPFFGQKAGVIRVVAGERYDVSGSTVTIRPENDADYEKLVRESDFGGVVHSWSLPTTNLAEASQLGAFSIHLLVQAMIRAKKNRPIAFVYPAGIPAFEAVGGYAKSLHHEHPDLLLKTIGSDSDSIDFRAELESSEFEVRYLAGRRQIKTLEAIRTDVVQGSSLRRGGVYLISGGAGGLGQIFARYFVERYDARLVLVGRSPVNETIEEQLRPIGTNAAYFSADIGTWEGARRAVDHAKKTFGAINGVIHAAGVLRDGLIWNKTIQDFAAVLEPKVSGAEALDEATSEEQLDCFVLFSSMSGLLGNAGQSDYAYANAYLDAFAYHRETLRRRGQRSGQTLSINWPVWRDGGMRATAESDRAGGLSLRLLEQDQGLEIFERALAARETQVWAGIGDRENIQKLILAAKNRRRVHAASPKPQNASKQPTELIGYLTSHLAGVLKLDQRQIKPSEPIESYGFDSIVAVEFSQLLEKDFGELSKTLLFEYPTIESLAAYLIERIPSGSGNGLNDRTESQSIAGSSAAELNPVSASGRAVASSRSLELAPTDYLFVGAGRLAIQVLYYFEKRLDFNLLQAGLQRVAQSFYPINSKLIQDGERTYIIEEAADPPDFIEVISAEELPEQDKPTSFQPFRIAFNPLVLGEKLAKFKLIQLRSGSLLNVNVSHAIADGYSYYYFLSAWAAACRGEPFEEPTHSRALLRDRARAYLKEKANQSPDDELEPGLRSLDPQFDPTTERIETLRIEPEQLIAEARKSVEPNMRGWLTENSVVTALVWQTYARAIGVSGELTLACPMDFRRIMPELSPAFFGNASAPAILRLTSEEVLNWSIGKLAIRISDSIRRRDAVTLIRYSAKIEQLRVTQGLAAVDRMGLVDPRSGLIVTNVARFPLPPVDFGSGKFAREYTPTNYAGTAVIVSEGAGIKVRLAYPS